MLTPQKVSDGSINVRVSDDATGKIINRYILAPGVYTGASTWVPTDVSSQPPEVQTACAEWWIVSRVSAYQAAHPYVAPIPPTPEQQRQTAIVGNARRKALVTAIQNNDDAGLIALIAQRYPALTGDGLKAVTDLALLAAAVIRN